MSNAMRLGKRTLAGVAAGALGVGMLSVGIALAPAATAAGTGTLIPADEAFTAISPTTPFAIVNDGTLPVAEAITSDFFDALTAPRVDGGNGQGVSSSTAPVMLAIKTISATGGSKVAVTSAVAGDFYAVNTDPSKSVGDAGYIVSADTSSTPVTGSGTAGATRIFSMQAGDDTPGVYVSGTDDDYGIAVYSEAAAEVEFTIWADVDSSGTVNGTESYTTNRVKVVAPGDVNSTLVVLQNNYVSTGNYSYLAVHRAGDLNVWGQKSCLWFREKSTDDWAPAANGIYAPYISGVDTDGTDDSTVQLQAVMKYDSTNCSALDLNDSLSNVVSLTQYEGAAVDSFETEMSGVSIFATDRDSTYRGYQTAGDATSGVYTLTALDADGNAVPNAPVGVEAWSWDNGGDVSDLSWIANIPVAVTGKFFYFTTDANGKVTIPFSGTQDAASPDCESYIELDGLTGDGNYEDQYSSVCFRNNIASVNAVALDADASDAEALASAPGQDPLLAGNVAKLTFKVTARNGAPVRNVGVGVEGPAGSGVASSNETDPDKYFRLGNGVSATDAQGVAEVWVYSARPGPVRFTANVAGVTTTATVVFLAPGRPSSITFDDLPSSIVAGSPLGAKAKVLDTSDEAVAGAPVELSITGDATFAATGTKTMVSFTDAAGTAGGVLVAGESGSFTLSASVLTDPFVNVTSGSIAITARPVEKTLAIDDAGRKTVNGKPGIYVDGSSTGFAAGDTLKVMFRFPGQTSYSAGSATPAVGADGEFYWQRKTGKRIYVYFTNQDGSVRSDRVIIPVP